MLTRIVLPGEKEELKIKEDIENTIRKVQEEYKSVFLALAKLSIAQIPKCGTCSRKIGAIVNSLI